MSRPALRLAQLAVRVSMIVLPVMNAHAADLPDLPVVAQPRADKARLDYDLKATDLGRGWHLIAGANDDFSQANGCNIINTGFLQTDRGVVVINTGTSRLYGEQQRALIDRVTGGKPVLQVIALNLHPDYFMGNQAYPANTLNATPGTAQGIAAEGKAYEDNLFRLCGDWMKGTQTVIPKPGIQTNGNVEMAGRQLTLLELKGHTASDLVVFDRDSGLMWAGGLVFHNRIVTTPHAQLQPWIESLRVLKDLKPSMVIPSHGPISKGTEAIDQTLDYLTWLDGRLTAAARSGAEINDVMQAGAPERFRRFAAYPAEFYRNVTNLYPAYERAALRNP
ncbi:quinoprotein relay system zinc metallohydrolase 1 [Limnobacter humi]|uniref:Quinoprotein relay system zinc metallohydrolase 1 n=1 Tax=Limnobacter humi TaxID=1778671 RepID=A0ABT1WGL5_9BURK|nr:quinoprotein relay system zinc metallohydrolase 1 [Limnobacter humi]MCQ8896667.1 quinoprotein relay system zinc metallohydrolase 1 [Limnobacter humi]